MVRSAGRGITTPLVLAAVVLCACVAAAVACSGGTSAQPASEGLRYEASTRLVDSSVLGRVPTVIATLVVTNLADTTKRFLWADCVDGGPVWLRAYRVNGDRTPVWSSYTAYREFQCDLVLHYQDVAPGGQWRFDLPLRVSKILADTLPAGTYSFTVSADGLQPVNRNELPAGQLTLSP